MHRTLPSRGDVTTGIPLAYLEEREKLINSNTSECYNAVKKCVTEREKSFIIGKEEMND